MSSVPRVRRLPVTLVGLCTVLFLILPATAAQTTTVPGDNTTTTTEVARIVGDPLPLWVIGLVAVALLAAIVGAGLLAQRAIRRRDAGG